MLVIAVGTSLPTASAAAGMNAQTKIDVVPSLTAGVKLYCLDFRL